MTYRQPASEQPVDQPRQRFVNRETDVDVPRQQARLIAVAWGTVIALATGGLAALALWWFDKPPVLSVPIGLGIGFVAAIVLYALNVSRFVGQQRRLLMGALEEMTGIDIDRDGYIGAPPQQTVRVEVVWVNESGKTLQMIWSDWPMSAEQVPLFARAILDGQTTESEWSSGRFLSRPQFCQMRGILMDAGWARWRNAEARNQGWELTAKGRALFTELATLPHPRAG